MRTLAAVGTGSVLVGEVAARTGSGSLAAGPGIAGGESAHRSGQRVSAAPAVVRSERHGRFAGRGLCGGGEGPAVPVSGSGAGVQAGSVRAFAAALERSLRRRIRFVVVRPDEHICGGRSGTESQSQIWLQPG